MSLEAGSDYDPQTLHTFNPSQLFAVQQGPSKRFTPPKQRMMMQAEPALSPTSPVIVPTRTTARVLSQGGPCEGVSTASTASHQRIPSRSPVNRMASGPKLPVGSREVPRIHTTYGVAVAPPPLTLEELEQQVKSMQETQAAHEQALRRLGLQGVESSILQRITERVGWEKEAFREEMTSLVSMEMQSFKATVVESTSNELAVIRSKLEAVQASVTYQASVTQRFEARLQVPASAQPQPQVQAAILEAQETADLVMRELTQLRIQVDALQANTMDAHATSESAARELQQLKIHVDAMQATFDSHQTTVNQRLDLRSPGMQVPFNANSGVAEAALKAAEQLRARVEHLEASLDSRTAPPSPTNQLVEAKGPGDEVLAWDVQKLKVDMEASQAKIQELARASKGLAALEKELQALQGQVQSAKVAGAEAVPELEKQVLQLRSQVEASQGKDFSAIQAHIDRLQGDLSSFAGEQRDTLLVQMSQLRSDLSSTHGRTVQVEAQLGKLRNDVAVDRSANVHGQVEQMRGDLNTFISEQHNPLLAQMAQLRADSASLPARTSQVEAQLVKMCADLAGLPRQVEASLWVAELKAQLAGLTTEVANLPRQGLEAELKSLQAELGSVATEQRESVLAQLAQLRGEVSGVFPRMTQLEAQGAQLRVQVSALPRSSEWEAQVANLRKEMQCLCQRPEPEGPGTFGLPTPRFELPDKEALRREVSMVLAEKGAAEAVDLSPVHSELERFREVTERMQEEVRELRKQSFHLRPSVGTWLQKPQALDPKVFHKQLEELRGDVALLQRKPAGDVAPLQCRVEQLHTRILDLESRPASTQAVEKLRAEVMQRLDASPVVDLAPVQGQLDGFQKELAWALPKLQAMDLSPIQSQLDMLRKEWSWMVAKLQSVDLSSVESQQASLQGEMARLGQRVQALDPTPVQSQLQVLRTKLASVEQTLQDPQRGAPVPLPLPQIDEFTVHERLDNFKTDVAYIMEKLQELDKPVPEAEDLVSVHVELDNFQAQLSKLTKEVAQLPEGSDIYKLQSQMARLEDEQLRAKHKLQELQEVPCAAPGITEAELGKLRATAVRLEAQQEVLTSEQVRLGADLAAVVRGTPKGSPKGSPRGDESRLGEILEKVDALARQQQAHEVERSSDVQAQSRFRLAMDEKMKELESRAEKFLADAVKASDGYKVDVHDELLRVRQQMKACQEAVFELQSLNLPEEVLLLRSELEVLQMQPGDAQGSASLKEWVVALQELQAKHQDTQRRLAALEDEPAGAHVRILDAVAGTEEAGTSADVRALREQLEAERSQRDELAQRLMREVSEVARQVELRCQELDERVEKRLRSSGEASGDGTGAGQSELKENQFVTFALVAELAARLDEEIAARKGLAKDAENRLSQSQRGWASQDEGVPGHISSPLRGSTSGGL